ncbi:PREDICTED: uncharacterized protein LOC109185268 [Ipomoea nil]|uniref:uncharacterized protein LOC109185268 n=1 Tax=Ipomoea nil TaxID=35883 RepID=UPI000900B82C|nr:PREDICTED: uncharacterized protein LOC109185268 [Ipomoea nil]
MYWGRENNGLYSVRSAYRLAFGNLEQDHKLLWAAVWNLHQPLKIKCFFWARCKLKQPTKDVLLVKQVACDPLCGVEPETAIHLFAECSFAHLCWKEVDHGWSMDSPGTLQLWIEEMWTALPNHMIEKVVTLCWAIWENRNSMVWDSQSTDQRTMVCMALAYVQNWKAAQSSHTATPHAVQPHIRDVAWSPPPPGYYKLNIDVSMDFEHRRMGYGWILRDEEGVVMGAATTMIEGIYSVKEAEAIGAPEALSWIKRGGWPRVVLETDAQMVTNAVSAGQNYTPFGAIIDEIRKHLMQLPLTHFVFVKRDANVLAHFLAKYALIQGRGCMISLFLFHV